MKFTEFPLMEALQKAIVDTGYTSPTPIQEQSIPPLLEGRDLLGCAQTGTGKTAAFALPILNRLFANRVPYKMRSPRALVLTPTRELTIQVYESFRTYGKQLRPKLAVVYGGVGQGPQVKSMHQGVDVLVATPGRLRDLIGQKYITLANLEIFVLDEADRMLDMGFIHDIREIIRMLPKVRQGLFFSATMPPNIEKLAASMLTNPVSVSVTPVSSTAELITQSVMFVERSYKRELLKHILNDKAFDRVIVFTRTKHGANKVVEHLKRTGVKAEAIHGNKSQSARQRALEDFRAGKCRVLVATDIAARGIDIDDVSHVINFELPNVAESYVHRIGRTARAGASGDAISFCDEEERAYLKDIEKLIGKEIPLVTDQPFHSEMVANARPMSKGRAKASIDGRNGGGPGGRRPGQQQRGRRPSYNRGNEKKPS